MVFKLLPPVLDNGDSGKCCCVTECAERPSSHVIGQVHHLIDVFPHSTSIVETRERFLQPIGTFTTGNAPAATLVLIELHNAERNLHHAGLIVNGHDSSGPEELSALGEPIVVHGGGLCFFPRQQKGGRSPGNKRFQLTPVWNPATYVIDHLLCRIAERQLVHAWLVEVACKTRQTCAPVLFIRSKAGVPLTAIENDRRNCCDGLNVVDDCWPAVKTFDRREGRFQARQSALAFERLHQRGLLANFVCAGPSVGKDVELASAAEDVLAQ